MAFARYPPAPLTRYQRCNACMHQTFAFTALPFVVPEYMFNFASMNRARAAGLTLPYLLNVTPPPLNSQSSRVEMHPPPNAFVCEQVGLIVDKIVQYALAWVSGGGCDVMVFIVFRGVHVADADVSR